MSYKIGQVVRGKVWSGEDYGFQSPATYKKLKQQGAFKTGAKEVRRIKQSVSRFLEKNTPKPIKDAASAYGKRLAKSEERYQQAENKAVQQGGVMKLYTNLKRDVDARRGKDVQALSDKTNVAPELIDAGLTAAEMVVDAKAAGNVIKKGRRIKPRGSQSSFGANTVGAAQKPKSQRIKTRKRNQEFRQFADNDDLVTAYQRRGDGRVYVSKSSLPGQQPLKGQRPRIELDMELMDDSGYVPDMDAPTPEVKRQRIKERLIKRETKGKTLEDAGSFEEHNVISSQISRGERAVSPITKKPTRKGITPIDTTEPKLPRSKRKPTTGSPPTRTEQRAYDKFRKGRLGQRLTAKEKKQLTIARKQLADEPRDWETRQFIERLERKRDGVQFRGEVAVDPRYVPGTVQGGTKRQANENLKRDLERKAAKERISPATRRRMTKESQGRMATNETLEQHPSRQVIRDEYTGDWEINTKADADKMIDQLVIYESRGRVDNFNQVKKARNALRTKQYEFVYRELLPADLGKAESNLKKLRATNAEKYGATPAEIADSLASITKDEVKRHAYWLREKEFARKFGYLDEARVTPGMLLKTDNRAGKESIRRQFRDARERRGAGDTKVRGKDRIRSRMQGARRPSAEDVSPRQDVLPPVQRNQNNSVRRTVPVGRTVLDQIGQPQGKPRKGGRIRRRFVERQVQRRQRIKRQR